MSLITTNSKVSNRAEHYDNNYPQPIVIEPNSQICLQKFIHTRDTDQFEVTTQNNTILYKFGLATSTGTGRYNPQRAAVLNEGIYTGDELATEIARALNASNQQQNFLFECSFTENPAAQLPNPTRTFTITLSQPASGTFTQNGGTWTSNGNADRFTIVNDDTAGNTSTIKFKEVGGLYGDDCFMRRGMLTHGGSHSVANIKNDATRGQLADLRVGVVSNAISTEGNEGAPDDGAGFNFSPILQDFSVQILNDTLEIQDLQYNREIPPGASGWRRERLLRTIPTGVLNSIRALASFKSLKITITTIQHTSAVVANTGGNWLVQLEYETPGGTFAVPAGTGGQIDGHFQTGLSTDAIQDITIGTTTYSGVCFFSGDLNFIQTTDEQVSSGSFVRGSRAAYLPTLCTDKSKTNNELIYYRLDNGNDWLDAFNPFFCRWTNLVGDDPDIDALVAGSLNRGYALKCEVFDVATTTLQQTFFARPQSDATGNRGVSQVNWDMVLSATLPAGGAASDHTLSVITPTGAAPQYTGIPAFGTTWTGQAGINGVLDEVTYRLNGYYNLETRQTSPPVLDLNAAGLIVGGELLLDNSPSVDESSGATGTHTPDALLAPPLVEDLPRRFFITFDSDANPDNQNVATIGQLLGYLRGQATGSPNFYHSNSTGGAVAPTYPYAKTTQIQPQAISGDTTLHISIAQLNNIKTYEGARTDLLQGATTNNAASNGDITNTIAVIPRQEFVEQITGGELVYIAPFNDWVNINNKTTLQINQLSVIIRNADGTMATDLKRETTAIFKIREDPEAAAERREDRRMENFAKMIQNQLDREVMMTGS